MSAPSPFNNFVSSLFGENLELLSDLDLDLKNLPPELKDELPTGNISARIWRDEDLRLRVLIHGESDREIGPREHLQGKLVNVPPVHFQTRGARPVTVAGMLITEWTQQRETDVELQGQASRVDIELSDSEPDFSIQWIANMPHHPLGANWPDKTKFTWTATHTRTRGERSTTTSFTNRGSTGDHVALQHRIDESVISACVGSLEDEGCYGFIEFNQPGTKLTEAAKLRYRDVLSFVLGRPLGLMSEAWFDKDCKLIRKSFHNPYILRQWSSSPDLVSIPRQSGRLAAPILQEVIQNILDNYERFDLLNVFWNYWHATTVSPEQGAVMLGAAFETIRDAFYRQEGREKRTQLLEDRTWQPLRSAFVMALDNNPDIVEDDRRALKGKIDFLNAASSRVLSLRFLSDLGLKHGQVEAKALQFRNTGAHGRKVEKHADYQPTMLQYRALQTLLSRAILAVSGSNSRYVDYSSYGHPARDLRDALGGPKADGVAAK